MNPTALIILDGYGVAPDSDDNAVTRSYTPVLDRLYASCPHSELIASGLEVGLPEGQIGNSEVGHTNIGAGRIVYQELTHISHEIETGAFFRNVALTAICDYAAINQKPLHIFALCSDGGVHSHISHVYALLKLARLHSVQNIYIHAFLDGRDVPPASGEGFIAGLQEYCDKTENVKIATVSGRYYAMDREERYDRLRRAYDAIAYGAGAGFESALSAVRASYASGVTDEFMLPVVIAGGAPVKQGDAIIFANFRPDRARELTRAFTDPDFTGFQREYTETKFVCMCSYDDDMPNVSVAYPPEKIEKSLGEIVSRAGLRQLRIAETTKYAHVTYFLNGGVEDIFPGEERILIPTRADIATFDEAPEMSAAEVASRCAERIKSGEIALTVVNFANCDMVGHTGIFEAARRAVEAVDSALGVVLDAIEQVHGTALIIADHGNAEQMSEKKSGESYPMTAHTTNPVPCILFSEPYFTDTGALLRNGILADAAPTILKIMGLDIPPEMTGKPLI